MDYDPIKDSLGRFFRLNPLLNRVFFGVLHLMFLRAWHVRKAIRELFGMMKGRERIDVLDAGTGFGQYAHFMVRRFKKTQVLAVDVKRDYLANAKQFFDRTGLGDRVTWEYEDLTDLQTEGPFDFVLSVDVMEHIEDDRAVFRHFARVLRPGGYVLINTPSDLGGSDVSGSEEASFIGEHVRDGYNMDELRGKLADAGIEPARAWYSYGTYGSLAWKMLIKYPMMMLNASRLLIVLLPFYYAIVFLPGMLLNWIDVRRENPAGTGLVVIGRRAV